MFFTLKKCAERTIVTKLVNFRNGYILNPLGCFKFTDLYFVVTWIIWKAKSVDCHVEWLMAGFCSRFIQNLNFKKRNLLTTKAVVFSKDAEVGFIWNKMGLSLTLGHNYPIFAPFKEKKPKLTLLERELNLGSLFKGCYQEFCEQFGLFHQRKLNSNWINQKVALSADCHVICHYWPMVSSGRLSVGW